MSPRVRLRALAATIALTLAAVVAGAVPAQALDILDVTTTGNGASAVALSPDGRTAYVTNRVDKTISVIDVIQGVPLSVMSTTYEPLGITIAPDGATGVITYWLDSRIQFFDALTYTLGSVLAMPSGPFDAAYSADGTELWVSDYFHNSVSVVDVATEINETVITGLGFVEGISLSPDGSTFWVGNAGGTIYALDADTRAVVGSVATGGFIVDIVLSPSGLRAFAADNSNDAIVFLDIADRTAPTVLFTVALPGAATGIDISPDESTLYVTAVLTSEARLVAYDFLTDTTRTVTGFSDGRDVISLPNSNGVLVADPSAGTVSWVADESRRIAGVDRYNTAVKISQQAYPAGAPVVYVATGTDYPDALAAGPAAAKKGGPLLLTANTSLPAAVKTEIERLAPSAIIVVGGTNRVSDGVKAELETIAPVTRITGTNRYETSRLITADAFGPGGASDVYIATGLNFPDALTAGAAGASTGSPVLLVNGQASTVDQATIDALNALGATNVTVVGGSNMVSDGILQQLTTEFGVTTERLTGTNRYGTGLIINQNVFASSKHVLIATGLIFPDALAASAWAGVLRAPLFIVPTTCVPQDIVDEITTLGVLQVTLIGGPDRLTQSVADLTPC
jgi:YVTN family beta-propeller protein